MAYYLSTNTIKAAYSSLTKYEIENASLLHIFFILKGCGYNKISYESVDLIAQKGMEKAEGISKLFAPFERAPDKYDFINPFDMKNWSTQPTESLHKWVSSRVKNNVLGGATTWRKLVDYDAVQNQFKLTYDYLNSLKKLTLGDNKFSLAAFSIWFNRYTEFDKPFTWGMLMQDLITFFKLDQTEILTLSNTESTTIDLRYSNDFHNTEDVRKLIGDPPNFNDWHKSIPQTKLSYGSSYKIKSYNTTMPDSNSLTKEILLKSLKDYFQIIVSGPPATSKSHLTESIARDFDKVIKIQFHPQFSYQEFVGGYFVNKDLVEYKKGIVLGLLDYISENPNHKVLLIIDEINRSNISQVFGDLIQCLDRNFIAEMNINGVAKKISLPKNLFIVGTMNSSDRSIGTLDHAVRRRFLNLYCPPNPDALIDLTEMEGEVSLRDFLVKLNNKMLSVLKNRELVIGQAIFFNENYKQNSKYQWNFDRLETLFNGKILPIIEDYCYGDENKVIDILGEQLPERLKGNSFKAAFESFCSV